MHYGSPSEKMQALCEIKAYFRLVFTQKTDDFTRFVNDCSIKVGYCISEGEFAAIVRLFSFVTDRLTFLKCIRKYLFNLKIWQRKFDSLFWNCVWEQLLSANSDKSAGLLSWTRIWQHLFSKMTLNVDKNACLFRHQMQLGALLLWQSAVSCWFNQLKTWSQISV